MTVCRSIYSVFVLMGMAIACSDTNRERECATNVCLWLNGEEETNEDSEDDENKGKTTP